MRWVANNHFPKEGESVIVEMASNDIIRYEYRKSWHEWWLRNIKRWLDESPSSDPEVQQLRQWKKEAMELLGPIFEYGRNHPDCKVGSRVTDFVLNRAKSAEVLVKKLDLIARGAPPYTLDQARDMILDALTEYKQLKQQ